MTEATSEYLNQPKRTEEQARADVLAAVADDVRLDRMNGTQAVFVLVHRGWDPVDAVDALDAALRDAPKERMISADLCTECALDGFTVEPECCGKPTIVWGMGADGEPLPADEECCGQPDPVQVPCMTCDSAAQMRAALREGSDQ